MGGAEALIGACPLTSATPGGAEPPFRTQRGSFSPIKWPGVKQGSLQATEVTIRINMTGRKRTMKSSGMGGWIKEIGGRGADCRILQLGIKETESKQGERGLCCCSPEPPPPKEPEGEFPSTGFLEGSWDHGCSPFIPLFWGTEVEIQGDPAPSIAMPSRICTPAQKGGCSGEHEQQPSS